MASTRAWTRYVFVFVIVNICSQWTKANKFSCKTDEVQFLCPRIADKCIPKPWECDGENDCGDNSDEEHCESRCDSAEKFLCHDGKTCIPKQWTCDGTNDCLDHSDENRLLCANKICSSDEFTCTKKKNCIPKKWKCDSEDDCDDKSDEFNCDPKPCRDTEFQCKNNKCIDKDWKCDHDEDCDDKSDELGCGKASCGKSEFLCNNTQKCIHKSYLCDNYNDCNDSSDESHCKVKTMCKEDKFDCKDGECIGQQWVCDGDIDCRTGEDEKHCPCPGEKIQCGNGTCISISQKCDGKKDCSDGSDERECAQKVQKKCTGQQFECDKSKCIDDMKVCDNKRDCEDNSDESKKCQDELVHIDECEKDNGGCHHKCINLKFGRRCACATGFELEDDKKSCRDINECDEIGTCSQLCKNKEGSYKCSCVAGYLSDGKDLRSCKAIERNPYLVFCDRYSIRKLTLHKSEFLGIVPNLPGSIALDYDLVESRMYWTDVHNETIQRTLLSNPKSGKVIVETIVTGIRTPDGIAVDWVARKLYWTDASHKRIEVSELDGRKRLVLIDTDLDMPRAVVLYPAIGEIFWTDWGVKPKIERCGMDGDPTSRKAIITKDIIWPNALTVDYTIDRIWWADAKRHVIEHCDLNGENRKVILTEHVRHPFSISVFEDNVYWTDWSKTSILKVNKFTGKNWTLLKENLLDPMGITVIHPQRQPAAFNFCQNFNGGCSYLCLLSAKRNKTKTYSCLCPKNINLLSHGRTCNISESLKCKKNMCHNGTCFPGNNVRGPICACQEGFSGLRCEYQLLDANTGRKPTINNEVAVTIGISVGVVVLIFISAAIMGIVIYKKLKNKYNPNSLNFDNPVYTRTTVSIESGGSLIPFRFRKTPPQPPFSKDPEPIDL